MPEEASNIKEELIIRKVMEYAGESKHPIQALWFGEENHSCGAILSEIKTENSVIAINFKDKILLMPQVGNFLILRTFFLFAPISGKVKEINGDRSVIIDRLSFVRLKNNKRRYPRFMLFNDIEAQLMVSNHIFSVKINDISKDGIGFIFSSERNMLGLGGKSGFIQLNYKNNLIRINGDVVWINRFSYNEYICGMVLYTNNKDKDIITDIIFENIFLSELELFKFISYVNNCAWNDDKKGSDAVSIKK